MHSTDYQSNSLVIMNYINHVGIDMSKKSFCASTHEPKVREYHNTKEGFKVLVEDLLALGYSRETTLIGVESTGVYHLPLAVTLGRTGWSLDVHNTLITSQMIKSGLRRVKNDIKDARVIREATILGKGYRWRDTDETLRLKTLVSERASLTRTLGQMKRFVEVHQWRESALQQELPDHFSSLIMSLETEIKCLEKEMAGYHRDTRKLLMSIPGVGKITATLAIAFIGDIGRFKHSGALVAYVGLDPRVHQSGSSVRGKGYISKRGNKLLRSALYMGAMVASTFNDEYKGYKKNLATKGKCHKVIMMAIARKIVCRIYAVWTRGTPYQIRVATTS
jgi:transposase